MSRISNPILPGFHPDPCIIRAGDCYYIATSTFEWWPGVQIHSSRDLAHWDLAGYAITRRAQANLRADPDSGGIWAPALSFADGKFWLVYSDVKSHSGPFKDVSNYLIWSERIAGPWSDPVFLNRSGFDPSLFHDSDGRKWLVNQIWKTSIGGDAFAGIALQEYLVKEGRLVDRPVNIFRGTSLGLTEGPHLYKKDGYYYLLTAEGGTEWGHAVTIARSRLIAGPYEVSPNNPLLTSAGNPHLALQKAGHGSLVQSDDGSWYLAHLCARPSGSTRRCILGRETALQQIHWPKGEWPRLARGGCEPFESFEAPAEDAKPYFKEFLDHFTEPTLGAHWNTLREPADPTWLSLGERAGFLRLRGRYSLQSLFDQSLVGIRICHHRCTVATRLEFAPASFQQSAGLTMYYNTSNFYYAYITADGAGRKELRLLGCANRRCWDVARETITGLHRGPIQLKAVLNHEKLQFFVGLDGEAERTLGPELDATILSDDFPAEGDIGLAFTGAFAALCCQDSSGERLPADFDWFTYRAEVSAEAVMNNRGATGASSVRTASPAT